MNKRFIGFLVIVPVLCAVGFFVGKIPANKNSAAVSQRQEICGAAENAVVNYVIDGDTIIVEGGWRVRLLGIDAQEKDEPCYEAAKTRLAELVLNKKVRLQKEVTDVDQYGRCLRTVFVEDEHMGVKMVREGLAAARFYGPDAAHQQELMNAEKYAFENNMGCLWGK